MTEFKTDICKNCGDTITQYSQGWLHDCTGDKWCLGTTVVEPIGTTGAEPKIPASERMAAALGKLR